MDTLKQYWTELCNRYSSDQQLIAHYFDEINTAYTESHRHYHTLEHIHSMLLEINACQNSAIDKGALLFATWFHDMVYNPRKQNNETASAEIAVKALKQLWVPENSIQKVQKLILATANHTDTRIAPDPDMDFFLDCDLKILGAPREEYLLYAENIRKEYKHVISFIYKAERKKVLKRFLESPGIYRTDYFRTKYESQARSNVSFEIQTL